MNASQKIKEELWNACQQWVLEKINTAQTAMNDAQQAANSEEKSSAGDKYETGRAMAQNERDRAAYQLSEALALQKTLTQIDIRTSSASPALGSLILTDKENFFLSISAGRLILNGQSFMAISSSSPIGKLLLQTGKGKSFSFNKQTYTVVDVK